ncbi:MAG: R3H domain-containing nucleic acid-binding protein [bacterium]|nr:R3H domain-containing nucleic acid-binding protein [bacterium]
MKPQLEIIKNAIETLLSKLSVKGEVEFMETTEGIRFLIKTYEGALLIGENGQNLLALNHIVKKIADKILGEEKKEEKIVFSLDVNDYQAKKIEDLKNLARLNAQRVRYFKKEITMNPMTSFERRVIHAVLTELPDITTESTGEEPNRRVVIKPYL